MLAKPDLRPFDCGPRSINKYPEVKFTLLRGPIEDSIQTKLLTEAPLAKATERTRRKGLPTLRDDFAGSLFPKENYPDLRGPHRSQ